MSEGVKAEKERDELNIIPSIIPSGEQPGEGMKLIKWTDIRDALAQRSLLTYLKKWVESIENYTQYVIRRLQSVGIVCEFMYNSVPTPDGYDMYFRIRLQYVEPDRIAFRLKHFKRLAEKGSMTPTDREFRKVLEETLYFEKIDGEKLDKAINYSRETGSEIVIDDVKSDEEEDEDEEEFKVILYGRRNKDSIT